MKTSKKILMLLCFSLAILISSCTKEGPIGPVGPSGIQGEQGEQGIAGQDGADGQNGADAEFNPIFFKVRGNGFAVKDLDANATIETDIWDIVSFDTASAFDTATKRYIIPETGYYFIQAYVRQSNNVTSSFFRLSFNVDSGVDHTQIVDGDDVKINVSGIYFLVEGEEVYARLRNFGPADVRIDGTGSWFEGYKIN